MNDEKSKQNAIPVDDGFSKDGDTSTTPIDERTEQEKALERIESIEVHHTDKNVEKSIDGVKGGANKLNDSQPPVPAGSATERAESTSTEQQGEHPALLAARKKAKSPKERSERKAPVVLILLLLLLLAAVAAAGWFFYQQQEAQNELSQVQDSLTTKDQKINSLTAANAKLTEASEESDQNSEGQPAAQYREIPEWNVRYEVTDANKNVVYGVVSLQDNSESLGFMSLDVAREVGINQESQQLSCGIGSAGMIMRLTEAGMKEFSQDAEPDSQKIGEHYYVYIAPQSLCSDKLKEQQTAASSAVSTIAESLEAIAAS